MPLVKGYSRRAIAKNIATEMHKHPQMKQAQAVAIAMQTARTAAKKAGKPAAAPRRRAK